MPTTTSTADRARDPEHGCLRHWLLSIACSLGLLTVALAGAAAEPPVVIGALYNLTGDQKDLDGPSSRGAQLAIDEANKAGGVLGRPIELVLIDGETKPDVIASETAKLLAQQPALSGLIGFSDTDMVLAAARLAAKRHRLFLTSGATSPDLPRQVPGYLFLACFGDNAQAAAGAEWAVKTLKARTAVVLYNGAASYSRLLHGYFEARFKRLGGSVLTARPYTPETFEQIVSDLPSADLVYIAALPDDAVPTVGILRDRGVKAPILGGDGFDVGDAWQQLGHADNIYFTTHAYLGADSADPRVQAFRMLYVKAYPGDEPGAFAALGYDTARLLLNAIKSAGSADPAAVLKALAATKAFAGVTGTIGYKGASHIPVKPVSIIKVSQGRQSLAASVVPEQVPQP
jgi:branched-chain amino acid transport system substrate-binding protein